MKNPALQAAQISASCCVQALPVAASPLLHLQTVVVDVVVVDDAVVVVIVVVVVVSVTVVVCVAEAHAASFSPAARHPLLLL